MAYSLRITCTSILFALNLTGEHIKWYMGWAVKGTAWTTYLRDVTVTTSIAAVYRHLTHPLVE